ncbi:mucin-2-like [Macrobrachium nipponense]|uniref:mucin-2-like n=1 Tax=Macrobrachium nipponense TaxID=159736 RepID=UPI0030C865A9
MIAYLALSLLVALATAQHDAPCECAVFININGTDVLLTDLPTEYVNFCDQHEPCQSHCASEFDDLTFGGDLSFETDDGPVGQILCSLLGLPVEDEFVSVYSNLCNTTWEDSGDTTLQPLCCDDSSNYYECPVPTTDMTTDMSTTDLSTPAPVPSTATPTTPEPSTTAASTTPEPSTTTMPTSPVMTSEEPVTF